METTFQRTRFIKRGTETNKEANSDSSDSENPYAEWKTLGKHIRNQEETGASASAVGFSNTGASSSAVAIKESGTSSSVVAKKRIPNVVSFLIGLERLDRPGTMLELDAYSEMISPNAEENCSDETDRVPIVEVDLTADSPEENSQEVSLVSRRISHNSRKEYFREDKNDIPGGLDNLIRQELISGTHHGELLDGPTLQSF